MVEFVKKYWDIIGGALAGIGMAVLARLELETVQLYYSIIVLVLVCIGLFRVIKDAVIKQRKKVIERKRNFIDTMVDGQKSVKAINLAQSPMKEGEKAGKAILHLGRLSKKAMNKFKTFFAKFKGYILTIALAILSVVEMCGGFINELCGGVLTVNGVEILPIVTISLTTLVGILSNGFTKEQMQQIKTLFNKSTTNELVKKEIKKQIDLKTAETKELNKTLSNKEHELSNLESQLEIAKNTHEAKVTMRNMTPQLATDAEVAESANEVVNVEARIVEKKVEIDTVKTNIENLTTQINALKSQL